MESLTDIKFEIIVAMFSEDTELYEMLRDFVENYEKVKNWHTN